MKIKSLSPEVLRHYGIEVIERPGWKKRTSWKLGVLTAPFDWP